MASENIYFLFDTVSKIILSAFQTFEEAQKVQIKLNDIDRLNTIDRLELKINKLLCANEIDRDRIKKLTFNICQMKNSTDKQIIYDNKQIARYIIYGINISTYDDFDIEYPYKKCLMLNI